MVRREPKLLPQTPLKEILRLVCPRCFQENPRFIFEKNKKKSKKFDLQIFIKIRKKIKKNKAQILKIRNLEVDSLQKVSLSKNLKKKKTFYLKNHLIVSH